MLELLRISDILTRQSNSTYKSIYCTLRKKLGRKMKCIFTRVMNYHCRVQRRRVVYLWIDSLRDESCSCDDGETRKCIEGDTTMTCQVWIRIACWFERWLHPGNCVLRDVVCVCPAVSKFAALWCSKNVIITSSHHHCTYHHVSLSLHISILLHCWQEGHWYILVTSEVLKLPVG